MTAEARQQATENESMTGLGPRGENLSIMIPNYNGSRYIAATLASLKEQGDRIAAAQISVVDNCSSDDSLDVVRRTWGDRVTVIRHDTNLGAVANWNACIDLAERQWVHILHSDDTVMRGAYEEYDRCLRMYPDSNAVYGRYVILDENGGQHGLSLSLGPDQRGTMAYDFRFWNICPVHFVSILISKQIPATIGYFDTADQELGSCTDWNLWWKIVKYGKVAYSNHILGGYRLFEGNWTSTILRTGKQKGEKLRQNDIIASEESKTRHLTREDIRDIYIATYNECIQLCNRYWHDPPALGANLRIALKARRRMHGQNAPLKEVARLIVRYTWKSFRNTVQLRRPTGSATKDVAKA